MKACNHRESSASIKARTDVSDYFIKYQQPWQFVPTCFNDPMRLLPILILCCSTLPLHALSSEPLSVLRVIDGDSIIVSGRCAGVELPIAVRLQYLDTPEMRDGDKDNPHGKAAKKTLQQLLKTGSNVRLWTQHKRFKSDGHGRVLALVYPVGKTFSVQEYMISRGYSVYWQRFGQTDKRLHQSWEALERKARSESIGLWATQRDWMDAKSRE